MRFSAKIDLRVKLSVGRLHYFVFHHSLPTPISPMKKVITHFFLRVGTMNEKWTSRIISFVSSLATTLSSPANRIYNKILDCDWFSTRLFDSNWRVISWVSNYSCPIYTFCNWIAVIGQLRCARVSQVH